MIVVDLRRERVVKTHRPARGRDAPGRQALTRRAHVLRRRHGVRRRLARSTRTGCARSRFQRHRPRRPRPVPEPRLEAPLRLQSRRGDDQPDLVPHAPALRKWRIPGGGSPDMGGVSADGRVLWLIGRYNSEVYAISTSTGRLLHRIRSARGRTVCASGPSPAATRSGTRGSCAESQRAARPERRAGVRRASSALTSPRRPRGRRASGEAEPGAAVPVRPRRMPGSKTARAPRRGRRGRRRRRSARPPAGRDRGEQYARARVAQRVVEQGREDALDDLAVDARHDGAPGAHVELESSSASAGGQPSAISSRTPPTSQWPASSCASARAAAISVSRMSLICSALRPTTRRPRRAPRAGARGAGAARPRP